MDYDLKQIFSSRHKKRLINKKLTSAAVLVPLFNNGKECHILLTKRSSALLHHKGQISFPGGKPHKTDSSLQETALRESWEEIGLNPKDVEVIGELDDTPTTTTGFLISPFVALIPYPYNFTRNPHEIDEILNIPLSALMDKSCFKQEYVTDDNNNRIKAYSYEYEGRIIWGATSKIIKQLLDTLKSAGGAQQ
jgi:8-oxo-dGTP pyrophosphatase MutT (NUDIX family)